MRNTSCVNSVSDQRFDCAIAFRCEGADQVCEPAESELSDDEICSLYAANARCGVERCLTDADCVRTIACPIFSNGQPTGQTADCTLGFRCQPEYEACQPRSTASDEALCANECTTGVIPDEP